MGRAFLGYAFGAIGMALAAPSAAEQLVVNNRTRTYVIERPAAKGPQPTIIVLQGTGGAPTIQSAKLSTLAPKQGFVAVFPDGPRPHWNFFPSGGEPEFYVKASAAAGGVADDGAFLKGLVANLVQRGIADPQRVYLAGESSGSAMALRMFCTNADLFAGVALLGSGMPERLGMDCHPSRPLPFLLIKGTKDEIYPYSGGLIKPDETFLVWSNDRLVSFLQQVNNHAGPPRSSFLPLRVPNTVAIDRWESCSATLLTVYRVIDGPHAAPSDLNASQVALNFFASPMRSNSCAAALTNSGANPGQPLDAGANGNTNAPGTDPGRQGAPGEAGASPNATPNTATADPGASGNTPSTAAADPGASGSTPGTAAADPGAAGDTPSTATGPTTPDPNGPGNTAGLGPPSDGGNPGANTAGLGPPSDGNAANPTGALGPPPDGGNPGTNTAGLGRPPDNNPGNPTGALGPPPDPPMNSPSAPGGTTTALLPPGGYSPPIYIPIPGAPPNVCHSKPASAPGNVCNPQPPNVCNRPPSTAMSTPSNPCNKPATPLILKPAPSQTAAIPPPQNSGMIHLRPATPIVPVSVAPVGPANPCVAKKAVTTADPPVKKKQAEKKKQPPARNDTSAADAVAAAATAAAIIGIVGGIVATEEAAAAADITAIRAIIIELLVDQDRSAIPKVMA